MENIVFKNILKISYLSTHLIIKENEKNTVKVTKLTLINYIFRSFFKTNDSYPFYIVQTICSEVKRRVKIKRNIPINFSLEKANLTNIKLVILAFGNVFTKELQVI